MKREAVQEERQRGAKLLPKQTDDLNPTSSVRDLTIERVMEAEQKSETRSGDNAIPYLRVGSNSVVQPEYKVCSILDFDILDHVINKIASNRLNFVDFRVPCLIFARW